MKVVIQCAGSKSEDAGSFPLKDGRKVLFVASPSAGLPEGKKAYVRSACQHGQPCNEIK